MAGPEAANNASAAGTLVPLLTLGLPASATAAVLLAAFQQFGLQAGPLLFQNEPRFVWTLLASLYVGNVLLLVLNLPLIRLWVQLLRLPTPQLYAGILVVATVGRLDACIDRRRPPGAGGDRRRSASRCGARSCPLAPVMIGVMLGPAADMHLRRALAISEGDWSVFLTRPIAAGLLATALLVLAGPALIRRSRPS